MLSRPTFTNTIGQWSVGQRTVALFLGTVYFIPLIGNAIFHEQIESIYQIYTPSVLTCLVLGLTCVGFALLSGRSWGMQGFWRSAAVQRLQDLMQRLGAFYVRRRTAFALVALASGLFFLWRGLSAYRYSSVGISDQGSLFLIVGVLIQTGVSLDQFYQIFVRRWAEPLTRTVRFQNVLFALSLVFLVNGTASMFLALFALGFSLFPQTYRRLLFEKPSETLFAKARREALCLGLCVGLFGLAWPCGEMIKIASSRGPAPSVTAPPPVPETEEESSKTLWGLLKRDPERAMANRERIVRKLESLLSFNWLRRRPTVAQAPPPPPAARGPGRSVFSLWRAFQRSTDELNPMRYGLYVLQSVSVHYYSLTFATNVPRETLTGGYWPPVFPISTMLFRGDFLTGGLWGVNRPDISSVALWNYRRLAKKATNPREGSSPGLIAGFEYSAPFPWSVLLCVLYLCLFSKILDQILVPAAGVKLGWVAMLLGLKYIEAPLSSPPDMLLLFDNGAFAAVLLAAMYLALRAREPVPAEEQRSLRQRWSENAFT
ncbi:hypothetical protein K2X33_11500 [bacterium]|nr:hypothetical protein [bacterium]